MNTVKKTFFFQIGNSTQIMTLSKTGHSELVYGVWDNTRDQIPFRSSPQVLTNIGSQLCPSKVFSSPIPSCPTEILFVGLFGCKPWPLYFWRTMLNYWTLGILLIQNYDQFLWIFLYFLCGSQPNFFWILLIAWPWN